MARASGWEYREKLHYSKGNVHFPEFPGLLRASLAGDRGRGGGSVCRESLPNGDSVNGDRAVQSHSSARLNVIASNGRMLTGASSWALAMSSHCPSSSSKASRVRSTGSMSHRCATPAPA